MKFELSEQMVAIIGKALGAMPYEMSAPVIAELQKQIDAQQKPNGRQTEVTKPIEFRDGA